MSMPTDPELSPEILADAANLAEVERRYARLADANAVGMIFWSLDGPILDANDCFLSMVGYDRAELERGAIDWRALTPPDYAEIDAAKIAELNERGMHAAYVKEYLHKSGRRVPVLVASAFFEGSRERGISIFIDQSAEQAAALERERLLQAERRARHHAERLQALTAALGGARTVDEVAEVLTSQGCEAAESNTMMIAVRRSPDEPVVLLRESGFRDVVRREFGIEPAAYPGPSAECLQSRQPIFVEGWEGPEGLMARFPGTMPLARKTNSHAIAAMPLEVAGRLIGVTSFSWIEEQQFTEDRREFLLAIAQQAAQGIERALLAEERERLFAAQQRSAERAAFLAEASRVLAQPLETDAVLRELARLPVPAFADYTMVYRPDARGVPHRVARTHASAERAAVLDQLDREFPLVEDSKVPAAHVLRAHTSVFMPEMSIEALRPVAPDPRYIEIVEQLNPCSGIVVPLVARGHALGALVLAMARESCGGSGRLFTPEDLVMAESLAERAALALDALLVLEEAERARHDAEQANRAKSDFLATMSHELRTPLNAIAGYVQLIEIGVHGEITEAQRDALARVQRAQERLLGLINDILNFARLEAGKVEYRIEPLLVRDVSFEVASLMQPQLQARGLTLRVQLPEDGGGQPVPVLADREKLIQVLLNLLSNAVKFTPRGGRIVLALATPTEAPHRAFIHVIDTGIGIPANKLDSIFEPFVQVGRSLANVPEGTGLGLAISNDLVRGMGGELTVQSIEGQGSTFTIALDRA